jgi:tetratricopeptide (TPR) repeat protein
MMPETPPEGRWRALVAGRPEDHPDPRTLERFMQSALPAAESRGVVRHLLTGCPECVAVTRRLWNLASGRSSPSPFAGASYNDAIARALGASRRREEEIAAERAAAPGLLASLLGQPPEKRLALVRRDERYWTVALADLLLERGLRERGADLEHRAAAPASALPIELAELAVAVAGRLDPEACGPSVARDLLGRAWTQVGEARQRAGDLPGAERAAASAALLLAETAASGSGERLELLRLEAAIAADRGRPEEAGPLLDRAIRAARAAGLPHLAGSALVEKGTLRAACADDGAAIDLLREGVELLDAEADPPLFASALHRLAALLLEAGQRPEARQVAARLLPVYERRGDRAGLLRLRSLTAKIEEDEAALLAAREGLLAEGLGAAAAQASLDLAVLYARKGRWEEIRRLAEEIFPLFRTRDLRRESMAALLVFRRAVETETASLEFLVEVAGYLLGSRRSRWRAL